MRLKTLTLKKNNYYHTVRSKIYWLNFYLLDKNSNVKYLK